MANWCNGVRSAQDIIEYVEQALRENNIFFSEVSLYPFRSNGGRSDGLTAWFERKNGDTRRHICISIYEHWNSDQIDLKISEWVPSNMSGDHDTPTVQFAHDQVTEVIYGIQNFLCQYFDIAFPEEWYIPCGFRGLTSADDDMIDEVDNIMMTAVVEFCDPEGKEAP